MPQSPLLPIIHRTPASIYLIWSLHASELMTSDCPVWARGEGSQSKQGITKLRKRFPRRRAVDSLFPHRHPVKATERPEPSRQPPPSGQPHTHTAGLMWGARKCSGRLGPAHISCDWLRQHAGNLPSASDWSRHGHVRGYWQRDSWERQSLPIKAAAPRPFFLTGSPSVRRGVCSCPRARETAGAKGARGLPPGSLL